MNHGVNATRLIPFFEAGDSIRHRYSLAQKYIPTSFIHLEIMRNQPENDVNVGVNTSNLGREPDVLIRVRGIKKIHSKRMPEMRC